MRRRDLIPGVLMILAAFILAGYSRYSIKKDTNTWEWHLLQWATIALVYASGFALGWWWRSAQGTDSFFHYFGIVMSVIVQAVPVYVFSLHRFWKSKSERPP